VREYLKVLGRQTFGDLYKRFTVDGKDKERYIGSYEGQLKKICDEVGFEISEEPDEK
jgi:hypothetical protein